MMGGGGGELLTKVFKQVAYHGCIFDNFNSDESLDFN